MGRVGGTGFERVLCQRINRTRGSWEVLSSGSGLGFGDLGWGCVFGGCLGWNDDGKAGGDCGFGILLTYLLLLLRWVGL